MDFNGKNLEEQEKMISADEMAERIREAALKQAKEFEKELEGMNFFDIEVEEVESEEKSGKTR